MQNFSWRLTSAGYFLINDSKTKYGKCSRKEKHFLNLYYVKQLCHSSVFYCEKIVWQILTKKHVIISFSPLAQDPKNQSNSYSWNNWLIGHPNPPNQIYNVLKNTHTKIQTHAQTLLHTQVPVLINIKNILISIMKCLILFSLFQTLILCNYDLEGLEISYFNNLLSIPCPVSYNS